jgi:hypothetical protein
LEGGDDTSVMYAWDGGPLPARNCCGPELQSMLSHRQRCTAEEV